MPYLSAFSVSSLIFGITFALILSERLHRTVIAFFGAVVMILVGMAMNFYTLGDALAAIDFNTIGLLFGMMVIVAIMEKTGFFQYLGIKVAKKTRGNPWLLLVSLGMLTAFFSMILDNVTTVILVAPVTIIITRILKLNPVPILIAEAILSNTGGVGTLVGDPPNIMIGSAAGFSFNDFLEHTMPVVLLALIVTTAILRFVYRRELKAQPENLDRLTAMNENEAIKDRPTANKSLGVLALVVLLFLTHNVVHIPPALVAIVGAALLLIMVSPKTDPQHILEKCELSVLLFFASLFVIVGGLEHAGVLEHLAKFITAGVHGDIVVAALVILWATAVLSAVVDNIPMTVAMIPIISFLGTKGLSVDILWWALALGVGLGGNGSPIGATANVIVISKSEQAEHPISVKEWLKSGLATTLASLIVASFAIVIFAEYFS